MATFVALLGSQVAYTIPKSPTADSDAPPEEPEDRTIPAVVCGFGDTLEDGTQLVDLVLFDALAKRSTSGFIEMRRTSVRVRDTAEPGCASPLPTAQAPAATKKGA